MTLQLHSDIATLSEPTYSIDIFIAGNRASATEALREFCLRGECVSITEADFAYTGGLESGVRVGLINYPRFPRDAGQLHTRALEIAKFLIERLHQQSCTVVGPDHTVFLSRRAPT